MRKQQWELIRPQFNRLFSQIIIKRWSNPSLLHFSEKLGSEVQTLLTSKNWKERKEGLEKIDEMLKANPFITGGSDMQEPLSVIAKLCTDVNKILGKTTLGLMEAFAKALSKTDTKKLVKWVFYMLIKSRKKITSWSLMRNLHSPTLLTSWIILSLNIHRGFPTCDSNSYVSGYECLVIKSI